VVLESRIVKKLLSNLCLGKGGNSLSQFLTQKNLPFFITGIIFSILFVFYLTQAGVPLWFSITLIGLIIFIFVCIIVIKKLSEIEKLLEKQIEQNAKLISIFNKEDK
jgi:ABC-type bacteriocin/lantibiotic exporter with double-glycine peptidase domain